MTTVSDKCKPVMEKVRVFFADKGFRHYDIVLRTVEWTGQTAGEGNYEVNDYPLTIQGRRIGVGLVKTADVVASGGEYTEIGRASCRERV